MPEIIRRSFKPADLARLQGALLDAYTTVDDLARLAANKLSVNRCAVVALRRRDLTTITEDLIRTYSESDAKLRRLVNKAAEMRPDYVALAEIVADWRAVECGRLAAKIPTYDWRSHNAGRRWQRNRCPHSTGTCLASAGHRAT